MDTYTVEVFYDGDCPLCLKEIQLLRWMDRRQKIRFTDIAAADFDPSSVGLTFQELMDRIHGRLADGQMIEGVEVFRQLYSAVGLGFIVALTRIPGVSHALDWAYRIFARHRLSLTGRCADERCTLDKTSPQSES